MAEDETKKANSSYNKDQKRIIPMKDNMPGKVLDGRYLILQKIGEGGMGSIYKSEQFSTGKMVAIKIISPKLTADLKVLKRFHREVKLQSKLEHPNIVTVLDFSKTPEGQYFFVMGLVDGKSIDKLIHDQGKFSPQSFEELAYLMLDGLEYAHSQGVVHRDIKWGKIL